MNLKNRSAWFRGMSIIAVAIVFALFAPILRTAAKKPSPPALQIQGKINIATWDMGNYLRVWEKASQGDTFNLVWTSARCHRYWSIDLGDVTGDGKEDIVGAMDSYAEGYFQGYFVVYEEGSTGYPSYISEPIGRGDSSSVFARKVLVADIVQDLPGNEIVLMTDNDLAVFKFSNDEFQIIAELSTGQQPPPGTFYDITVANLDGVGNDEIVVSVFDPGQVWLYKYEAGHLVGPVALEPPDPIGYDTLHICQQIRTADINGDGYLDIMAFSRGYIDGSWCGSFFNTWVWNSLSESYECKIQQIGFLDRIFRFDAADLDADDWAEVVIAGGQTGIVEVWKWNGAVFVAQPNRTLVGCMRTLSISDFGQGPRIILSGSFPTRSNKSFYLGVFEASGPNLDLDLKWKFEGSYYWAGTHGNN